MVVNQLMQCLNIVQNVDNYDLLASKLNMKLTMWKHDHFVHDQAYNEFGTILAKYFRHEHADTYSDNQHQMDDCIMKRFNVV